MLKILSLRLLALNPREVCRSRPGRFRVWGGLSFSGSYQALLNTIIPTKNEVNPKVLKTHAKPDNYSFAIVCLKPRNAATTALHNGLIFVAPRFQDLCNTRISQAVLKNLASHLSLAMTSFSPISRSEKREFRGCKRFRHPVTPEPSPPKL